MSAITRFEGADYAYNLHTGVDKRYRGRKVAQAVKVLALRFARDVLKVGEVRTNHNSQNDPMIAIDRKFGYVQTHGEFCDGEEDWVVWYRDVIAWVNVELTKNAVRDRTDAVFVCR
ncbi:MAG: GNAT family N-acetyltransferase [Candidatus Moduliflexus flocculans]|nr:GNAT family N-acetyltransferase [Candidatus Moduliflexus flocculans]